MIDEKWIDEFCEKYGYNKKKYGKNNPTLVILGETHGSNKERSEQDELIVKLGPKYVLSEILMVMGEENYRDDEYFTKWKEEYPRCELVGCDLSNPEQIELKKDLLRSLTIQQLETLRREVSVCEDDRLFKICAERYPFLKQKFDGTREERMGKIVLDHSENPSKPLVAVIGHRHADKSSEIHNILKGKVDYIAIWDC